MFDLSFGEGGGRDDNLILSDPIVMNHNMISLAPDYLNQTKSKLYQIQEKLVQN